jgi:hypothetical protein
MSTLKELVLSPFGIVFEPLGVLVDGDDDPQAAAARPTTAARLTQPTGRNERERRPPLLLSVRSIPKTSFAFLNMPECVDAGNHTARASLRYLCSIV